MGIFFELKKKKSKTNQPPLKNILEWKLIFFFFFKAVDYVVRVCHFKIDLSCFFML